MPVFLRTYAGNEIKSVFTREIGSFKKTGAIKADNKPRVPAQRGFRR